MIQTMTAGRAVLLKVFDLDSNVWNQRIFRNEVGLAFGLTRPGFANTYGEIDFYAIMLTITIARYFGMKTATAFVINYWRRWLEGLALAEHTKRARRGANHLEEICFVIGVDAEGGSEVEIGECEKIYNKFVGAGMLAFPIPLDLVLRRLRNAAKKAGVSLPKQFTPGDPESPEFQQWIEEIKQYTKFAEMRGGGASRVKKRKAKATA